MVKSHSTTSGAIVFIPDEVWIPRVKTLIGTTDITTRIKESEFTRPIIKLGIGTFKIKLINVNGYYSGSFSAGDSVDFYADNNVNPPTTKRFVGKIDYIKEEISRQGQYLVINGRHKSGIDMEKYITYSTTTATDGATVLKAIVAELTGYTTNNVTDPIGKTVDVSWSEKPFEDCFKDLCTLCNADGYVDDDSDFHFFPKNPAVNENDAIHERYNLIWVRGFGKDTYPEKTQIRVYGKDDEGLPILYTENTSGTKELVIKDTAIDSTNVAENIGSATKTDLEVENEQGRIYSRMLFNVNPGDRIWFSAPRQNIHKIVRIASLKYEFKHRGLHTESVIEKEELGTSLLLQQRKERNLELRDILNPNKLLYSYNFTFDDDTDLTHYQTETTEGRLQLQSGETTGTCTTSAKTTLTDVTYVELRIKGSDLTSSTIQISADGGSHWQTVTKNTYTSVTDSGNQLRIRMTLLSDTDNPNPIIDSIAILYK